MTRKAVDGVFRVAWNRTHIANAAFRGYIEQECRESGILPPANQAFDYVSDKYTIEHILPEHPDESWTTFTDEQADRCVYGIGNLTPLEATANRDIGNKSYEEKKGTYAQSGFEIARRVASDHSEWTPGRIATRQQWLANQATAILRLPELSQARDHAITRTTMDS